MNIVGAVHTCHMADEYPSINTVKVFSTVRNDGAASQKPFLIKFKWSGNTKNTGIIDNNIKKATDVHFILDLPRLCRINITPIGSNKNTEK